MTENPKAFSQSEKNVNRGKTSLKRNNMIYCIWKQTYGNVHMTYICEKTCILDLLQFERK